MKGSRIPVDLDKRARIIWYNATTGCTYFPECQNRGENYDKINGRRGSAERGCVEEATADGRLMNTPQLRRAASLSGGSCFRVRIGGMRKRRGSTGTTVRKNIYVTVRPPGQSMERAAARKPFLSVGEGKDKGLRRGLSTHASV